MDILEELEKGVKEALLNFGGLHWLGEISFQKTRKEFKGEITLATFAFARRYTMDRDVHSSVQQTIGDVIGEYLRDKAKLIKDFEVKSGFLNLSVADAVWINYFSSILSDDAYAFESPNSSGLSVMIEYPSPNTNKPLHLGHLRNIFLGSSLAEILKARGHKVIHACLYNDRGTNISKSMLAWKLFGNGATPESTGKKGDKFVGDFYVEYFNANKKETDELKLKGLSEEEANNQSSFAKQVNDLTIAWENNDAEVRQLWKTMNTWVYDGFDKTYSLLGIKADKNYYESDVFDLGKQTVLEGLEKGIFYKKEDGSVWIDLTNDGLDHKLVLRSNGTSVYITQDIATANEKDRDFKLDKSIYVVGNEQDYHFKVLFLILKKLGRKYADNLYHLSYGMVELPTGKMKSRQGTVVDADDLIEGMIDTARETTTTLGKTEGLTATEATDLYSMLGLGALRYFILKVDPKKKMLFDPAESIDFNGNTGPFIQYTHARIQSVIRKANVVVNSRAPSGSFLILNPELVALHQKEIELIHLLSDFKKLLKEAETTYNPALVANYIYEVAKGYNSFYHELSVLNADTEPQKLFRLQLSYKCALTIKQAMALLCVEVPERM